MLDWFKQPLGSIGEAHRGYYPPDFVLAFSGAWNSFPMLG